MMITMNALSLFTFAAMLLVALASLFAVAAEMKPASEPRWVLQGLCGPRIAFVVLFLATRNQGDER